MLAKLIGNTAPQLRVALLPSSSKRELLPIYLSSPVRSGVGWEISQGLFFPVRVEFYGLAVLHIARFRNPLLRDCSIRHFLHGELDFGLFHSLGAQFPCSIRLASLLNNKYYRPTLFIIIGGH